MSYWEILGVINIIATFACWVSIKQLEDKVYGKPEK